MIVAAGIFAVLILGVLIGRTYRTQTRGLSIADVGDAAVSKMAKHLWSKDLTHSEFGRMCADIRDRAWDDKDVLERVLTINKTQTAHV